MIKLHAKAGELKDAEWWMQQMLAAGIAPCLISFTTMMTACVRLGHLAEAETWFSTTQESGVQPDHVMFRLLIFGWMEAGDTAKIAYWFCRMLAAGVSSKRMTTKILADVWSAGQLPLKSYHLLQSAKDRAYRPGVEVDCGVPELELYHHILDLCISHSDVLSTEWWLTKMVLKGLHPDDTTLTTLLGSSRPNALGDATGWTHAAIIRAYATVQNTHQVKVWYAKLLNSPLWPPATCQLGQDASPSTDDILQALEHLTLHSI